MNEAYGDIIGIKRLAFVVLALLLGIVVIQVYARSMPVEVGFLMSAITFVYGFFLSSLFGFVQRKYQDFVTNMADLSGHIQTFYNLVELSGQEPFKAQVRIVLREFITEVKQTSPRDYETHQHHVDRLFKCMGSFKIKTKRDELLYARMINALHGLAVSRERTEMFGERYFVGESRVLFVLLTAIVAAGILAVSVQHWLMLAFGSILVLALVFVGHLLFSIDHMRYGKSKIRTANLDDLLAMLR